MRTPTGAAFVRAIVDLAHVLGLGVVAEGVETLDLFAGVIAAGCDEAQGFHLARPMSGTELLAHPLVVPRPTQEVLPIRG